MAIRSNIRAGLFGADFSDITDMIYLVYIEYYARYHMNRFIMLRNYIRLLWNKYSFAIYFYWNSSKLLIHFVIKSRQYIYTSFSRFDTKFHCRNLFLCTFFSLFYEACVYKRFSTIEQCGNYKAHGILCLFYFFIFKIIVKNNII